MKPIEVYLTAVAFASPGIPDWTTLQERFAGRPATGSDFKAEPDCLPRRAMRRLSPQIRLALSMAELVGESLPPDAGWVFASCIGEGETLHVILDALRTPEMMVQPVRFQNSVHNAPSGQWTIAAGLHGPVTSIGSYDQTVGAGLLKAAMQLMLESRSIGLVCYDCPLPEPLHAVQALDFPAGAALSLSPGPSDEALAKLEISRASEPPTEPQTQVGRELCALYNPVTDILPLLEAVASRAHRVVRIGLHGGGALEVAVDPS